MAMTDTQRAEHVARDTILKLLSDEEIAKVSSAESASKLADGEEYLDMEHLDRGVQRATSASKVTMGNILPRRAVSVGTWAEVLAHLAR
jgi:hypothetical protein